MEQDGMRQISDEKMARMQAEGMAGARNVGMEGLRGFQAARNSYHRDPLQVAEPERAEKLTRFQRIARWFKKGLDIR